MNVFILCIQELLHIIVRLLNAWIICVSPIVLDETIHVYSIEPTHESTPSIPIEETWIDYLYEEIDNVEYTFHQYQPELHRHYIGSVVWLVSPKCIVLGSVVSPRTYFQYPIDTIDRYLTGYDSEYVSEHNTHIVQIVDPFVPGFDMRLGNVFFYSIPVVIKTYWIRIIQRTWKRVYREKCAIIRSLAFLRKFELEGNCVSRLPSLRGMLCPPPLFIEGE